MRGVMLLVLAVALAIVIINAVEMFVTRKR